jgi:hypothetical protein
MSTTSTTFGRDATSAPPNRTVFGVPPTRTNPPDASASDDEGTGADQLTESGDDADQGGDESADGQEEEEAEGEDDEEDGEYSGRSPSLSPVAEERETDEDQSQTETIAPTNLFGGLSFGNSTTAGTEQRTQSTRERSLTPSGSRPAPQTERNQPPSLFAPAPKQPSPRGSQLGQAGASTAEAARPFRGGKNGLLPTPPISSPLSKPPIFGTTIPPAPERPTSAVPKAQAGFQQPLPPDAPDKPSIARQKTPPLLFGMSTAKPKPGVSSGGFTGFGPPSTKANSPFEKGAGASDPPKFGVPGSLFGSTPPQKPSAQSNPRGSFGESSPVQTQPPARPKAENPMEAEFLRVISLVNEDIAKVRSRGKFYVLILTPSLY